MDSSDLIDQLEQQLQELDATEFDLPEVSELPTLESILNEPEGNSNVETDSEDEQNESEAKASLSSEQSEAETASVHSLTSSRGSDLLASNGSETSRSRRENVSPSSCSIVRHVALTGIASQLISAHDRVSAGLPTTMAVGSMICVGTSHGLVMVFEPSQSLKWCLGSTKLGELHGSVSALAISEDGTRLLAGYAKGHLCLFDLTTGNAVQSIIDAHTACTAVLHLKWTDFPNIAIMSDSGGSVFELAVKRTMGLNSNMSRCIFTGSRGEVCTLEPLVMSRFNVAPLLHNVIVAMATITKVIVVSLRPAPKVLFSHSLKASSSTLPLLAWQFVVIQMPNKQRIVDPVLAFGRQNTIYFYQLTHGAGDNLQFLPLRKITTDYLLHNMAWLNPSTLALLDSNEHCHVLDVRLQKEIEAIDLNELELVYASQHFKASATGGNVSRAMAVAGERACYHSMVSFGSQVLLLGTKSLQVLTLRNWSERLDQLMEKKLFASCLQLAREMVTGRAIAVVGLPQRKSKRKVFLCEKITAIIEVILEDWHVTAVTDAVLVVTEMCWLCVESSLHDLLIGEVWETMQDNPLHKGVFLECLENFIISDNVKSLPPSITQQFLNHYESNGKLDELEACIVRLSVTSLDLHQTMTLCWMHGLYDAIIYVYTNGMKDYVSPIEELTTVMISALDNDSIDNLPENIIKLGNKLLVYISCCLAGRGYPRGNIEHEYLQTVKYEVFKCLSAVHSKNAKETQKPFPYLQALLRFDTREFLNVLSLAFGEAEFKSDLGILQKQRLIGILMQVMSESPETFTSEQVCSLYIFIARQLTVQNGSASRNTELIDSVVDQLCKEDVLTMKEDRQGALLDLLQDNTLVHIKPAELLKKANKAKFYRISESLYIMTGEFQNILSCYLLDPSRQHQVLPYLQHALNTQPEDQVKHQLLHHLKDVVNLDPDSVAGLILSSNLLTNSVQEFMDQLEGSDAVQYELLRALFDHLFAYKSSHNRNHKIMSSALQVKLIDLMCSEDPTEVLSYLKKATGTYDNDTVMTVCRKHAGQEECVAFLLLQKGQVEEALKIHLSILKNLLDKMKIWAEDADTEETDALLKAFEGRVVLVSGIIQSHCKTIEEESERQKMWFPLLDLLISPPAPLNHSVSTGVGECCGSVVSTMIGQVSPPVILQRVLKQPQACQSNHITRLMNSLISRYKYEQRVYSAMCGAIRAEQLACVGARVRLKRAPIAGMAHTCSVCDIRFSMNAENLLVLQCGHCYHLTCYNNIKKEGEDVSCYVCNHTDLSQLTFDRKLPAGKPEDQSAEGETNNQESNKPLDNTATLTPAQKTNLNQVYQLGLTGCRMSLLETLSRRHPQQSYMTEAAGYNGSLATTHDKWLSEKFPLNLAPPSHHEEYRDL